MDSTLTMAPKGKGRGGKSTPASASSFSRATDKPTPKRQRESEGHAEDDDKTEMIDLDPKQLIDSIFTCLTKNEKLLDNFISQLFEIPSIQDKLIQKVVEAIKSSEIHSAALSEPMENAESEEPKATLVSTVKDLTSAVHELKDELRTSTQRCDDLEQYSRRNNIIISGVPDNSETSTETQICNIINDLVASPIEPTDIDRCHRLNRPKTNTKHGKVPDKPADIIVKFVSYKSKAKILTKDPMEKLREDNKHRDDQNKLFIREDLTKARNKLHYKTRLLKKAGLIKDTFSRDGMIVVKVKVSGKTDLKQYFISSENDLKNICKTHKLAVDEELKPRAGAATAVHDKHDSEMDTSHIADDSDKTKKNLDPHAAVFKPTSMTVTNPGTSKSAEPIVKSLFSDILKSK